MFFQCGFKLFESTGIGAWCWRAKMHPQYADENLILSCQLRVDDVLGDLLRSRAAQQFPIGSARSRIGFSSSATLRFTCS